MRTCLYGFVVLSAIGVLLLVAVALHGGPQTPSLTELPAAPAASESPAPPASAGDLRYPASLLPAAPPDAVEQIDLLPARVNLDRNRDRRRRRKRVTVRLRFYRDADGRVLDRVDCSFPGRPELVGECRVTGREGNSFHGRFVLRRSGADGAVMLHDLILRGSFPENEETFACELALCRPEQPERPRHKLRARAQRYPLPSAVPDERVTLRAPLATLVPVPRTRGDDAPPRRVTAELAVPADAPADLLVGAFCRSYHGEWFQTRARPLAPGRRRLSFDLRPGAVACESDASTWSPATAARHFECGLYLCSAGSSRAEIRIVSARLHTEPPEAHRRGRLLDLAYDPPRIATGQRWTCRFRPDPPTPNPYIDTVFAAELRVTDAAGATRAYPAFYRRPLDLVDRGDREIGRCAAPGHFTVRFRPRRPGRYHLVLRARWTDGAACDFPLPDLSVAGFARDDYVRVDPDDPRFLSVGRAGGRPRFYWPTGINLRSVFDVRSRQTLKTELTPNRILAAYRAYLDRMAAAGIDCIEIWMASWNLALEWHPFWPGYDGIHRYNQANAERLDLILEAAWRRGIRVLLVINNHGQASRRCDREWSYNPWNTWNGGPLDDASAFFNDPRALAGQRMLRRYLVGRYADHPAVLGWKVFSEINLTALRGEDRTAWHTRAADHLHAIDHYGHPVTTHWAGTYRNPYPEVCALPALDFITIDAYHGKDTLLPELLRMSTQDPGRGLGRFGKPVMTTEFGGSSRAAAPERLLADHLTGPWSAFVSGLATCPLLWWFEWVDQGNRWAPYRAIDRFKDGEDLRGAEAGPLPVRARARTDERRSRLWAAAWRTGERALVYVVDHPWAVRGGEAPRVAGASLRFPEPLPAGAYRVEWWNPDDGTRFAARTFYRPDGLAELPLPTFRRHLAAKVSMRPPAATRGP